MWYKIICGDTPEMCADKVNQELSLDSSWQIGPFQITPCGKTCQVLYKNVE